MTFVCTVVQHVLIADVIVEPIRDIYNNYLGTFRGKNKMAASGRGARAALAWNDWDRKRKLLVILKMLIDGVAPFMLERTIWCRQWLLRR